MALLYTKALHSNIKNISPAYIKVHFSLGQSYVMHSQPKQPKDWRELDPSQDSDHTWLAKQGEVLHISVCAMCIFVTCEYLMFGCSFVCL